MKPARRRNTWAQSGEELGIAKSPESGRRQVALEKQLFFARPLVMTVSKVAQDNCYVFFKCMNSLRVIAGKTKRHGSNVGMFRFSIYDPI